MPHRGNVLAILGISKAYVGQAIKSAVAYFHFLWDILIIQLIRAPLLT